MQSPLLERPVVELIRFHHFLDILERRAGKADTAFGLRLQGETDEARIMAAAHKEAAMYIAWREPPYPAADRRYARDLIGSWTIEEVENSILLTAAQAGRIALLGDNEVARLTAGQDVICNIGCAVGDHCLKRDITRYGGPADTIKSGEEDCAKVTDYALRAGLEEGTDFMFTPETLSVKERNGRMSVITARSMLITLGSIHSLIEFACDPAFLNPRASLEFNA